MQPNTVNLDHAVASFLEMREISWQMGLASLLSEGMTHEEAGHKLAEIWIRASVARERRWKPKRNRTSEVRS